MSGNAEPNGRDEPKNEPVIVEIPGDRREDRTETANRDMVELALQIPDLLATLFAVRDGDDRTVAANSADTITKVAQRDPRVVLPYSAYVVRGLDSAIKQVRWESLTTLRLLATIDPGLVAPLTPRLHEIIRTDRSVIARDRAIDALASYGRSTPEAARVVVPLLIDAAEAWEGKHAARALRALCEIAPLVPQIPERLRAIAGQHAASSRPSARAAAKRLGVLTRPPTESP